MNPDFLATLNDLPPKHHGVLMQQIHQASLSAVFYMRAMGLTLKGVDVVPTYKEVSDELQRLANLALESYFTAEAEAPTSQHANEIWGEVSTELFALEVTGMTSQKADGFVLSIDFNLLYGNR